MLLGISHRKWLLVCSEYHLHRNRIVAQGATYFIPKLIIENGFIFIYVDLERALNYIIKN
jgi:NAD dependent epimerase/dehydratase family enzyme